LVTPNWSPHQILSYGVQSRGGPVHPRSYRMIWSSSATIPNVERFANRMMNDESKKPV
jgi:hypothetical protein